MESSVVYYRYLIALNFIVLMTKIAIAVLVRDYRQRSCGIVAVVVANTFAIAVVPTSLPWLSSPTLSSE